MRRALIGIPVVVLLSACAPVLPTATPTASPTVDVSTSPTPSPVPTAQVVALPADALILVTATATASNGATMNLRLVAHRSVTIDGGGLDAANVIAECQEINADIMRDQRTTITNVDVSATLLGSTPWPGSDVVWLFPGNGGNVTTGVIGDLDRIEHPRPIEPPAYVPRSEERRVGKECS